MQFDNHVIATRPLYSLETVESGGIFARAKDSIRLTFRDWFGSN